MPLSRIVPAQYESLLEQKVSDTRALLAGFSPPEPEVYPSPRNEFRMRAEFRMWHEGDELNYVMYRPEDRKTPVPVHDLPIACQHIRELMPRLREIVKADTELRRKLFQVEFLSTLAGDTLITLIYHRKLDERWLARAEELEAELDVVIVGRSRKQKLIPQRDYVTEVLPVNSTEFFYRQYEQAFTQPNASVNRHMIEWACRQSEDSDGDLLELYCGNGNFTLPLAAYYPQVIATELSKVSSRAAQHNLQHNGVENVHMIRLSAEEVSQAMAGEREFRRLGVLPKPLGEYQLNTVFVDPPRAGLDAATVAMVAGFPKIIYISCNPETLAANLSPLSQSHEITAFALFDQFPYTDHMECGVVLQQRMP